VDNDVAAWGRTAVDPDANSDQQSMSSGLSARDQEWSPGKGGMRPRPFDQQKGLASFVHHTKQYISSQQHRK